MRGAYTRHHQYTQQPQNHFTMHISLCDEKNRIHIHIDCSIAIVSNRKSHYYHQPTPTPTQAPTYTLFRNYRLNER